MGIYTQSMDSREYTTSLSPEFLSHVEQKIPFPRFVLRDMHGMEGPHDRYTVVPPQAAICPNGESEYTAIYVGISIARGYPRVFIINWRNLD